ncbi:MAG TPA: excalibur calcium-binding domain-containing protein [Solirubrobacteraceae bacterium]|jgi:hypothetical protein|nr:excalibur calcium-binding domain-containing protein [Solirubrobacteraceae bacterium]
MSKGGAAGRPRWSPPSPRTALISAAVVAVVVVVVVLLSRGGDDSTARANPDCTPATPRSGECPHNKTFDPARYLNHGDAYQCTELASQADAQAVLRADPSDPNHLAEDGDGIACSYLPPPKDLAPVAKAVQPCHPGDERSARCPQPKRHFDPHYFLRHGGDEYDCTTFASQADAQAVLRTQPQDFNKLDGDGDGIACPGLPAPKDLKRVQTRLPS